MIISRTPFRISFFGGGTDYPTWFEKHTGVVVATTINKYCYLTCRYLPPFFEHRIRVIYSKVENCQTIDEIVHPSVREVMRYLNFDRGIEIHHDADLPARSGMGSSSAFTVGLLNVLHALKGHVPTRHQLAAEAIHVEQDLIKESVGSQDQVQAAHGGFNRVEFLKSGEFSVTPITVSPQRVKELESHLMLFYTGIKRTASNIASSFINDLDSRRRQLRTLVHLADESINLLTGSESINGFGELLNGAWETKRSLSKSVSNEDVDSLYQRALSAGGIGGKLTGAGGGGFLLMFVPPDKQESVKNELSDLIHVPFKFEYTGSQIIFYDVEEDFSAQEEARLRGPLKSFRELGEGLK